MGEIIFIVGGARSGKSGYARELASGLVNGQTSRRGELVRPIAQRRKIAFIATAEASDPEMKKRIGRHRAERNRDWKTFEAPSGVAKLINAISPKFDTAILDCLTLLINNMMLAGIKEKGIEKEIKDIIRSVRKGRMDLIIVSNEVGLGIVPDNKLAREFRDVAGRLNQVTAKAADSVFFTVSGLPFRIK